MTTTRQRQGVPTLPDVARGRWALPLLVFALSRVASGLLVTYLGRDQDTSYRPGKVQVPTDPDPASYLHLLTNWDGDWYLRIAAHGYPGTLPTVNGEVIQNVWAFYPVFPGVMGLLGKLGIPLPLAATAISTTCAALAMVLLYAMLRPAAGSFTALLTVAAFSFSPPSLVLQAAYTEGPALLMLLGALWCLRNKKYAGAAGIALLLSLTRPLSLPLAAVIGVLWVLRLQQRGSVPFPRRELVQHGALALFSAATFLIWPAVCGIVTGVHDGYALTQQSWVYDDKGWITWLSGLSTLAKPSLIIGVPTVIVMAWLGIRKDTRVWGADLRAWVVLYPLYILAVSRPTTSVLRYLMMTTLPAWPLPELSSRVVTTRGRVLVLLLVASAGLVTQYWWIQWFWLRSPDGYGPP